MPAGHGAVVGIAQHGRFGLLLSWVVVAVAMQAAIQPGGASGPMMPATRSRLPSTCPAPTRPEGGVTQRRPWQGMRSGAIAESLVLTKRAVEKHINAIFLKLDLADAHDVSKCVKAALMLLWRS